MPARQTDAAAQHQKKAADERHDMVGDVAAHAGIADLECVQEDCIVVLVIDGN